MKAFVDKIVLAVGVLALAGGAGFYVTQKGQGGSNNPLIDQQPSGTAYENLSPAKLTAAGTEWPEPVPQDGDGYELYDVFTPPKIWWDAEKGIFVFEPPIGGKKKVAFGLALLGLDRELYRIQMEAFFGRGPDAMAQIYDDVTQKSYRGKVGEKFEEIDTAIVALENELVTNPDGTIRRIPRVTLLDGASGEEITLTTDERLYVPNKFDIKMEVVRPYPSEEFLWKESDATHSVGDVTWKLLEFNFDNQSVTVEKTVPEQEIETETLVVTTPSSASESAEDTSTEEENAPAQEISPDDGLFF
ncbi:MAG: hypothetical protein AAFX93_05095 [Verrucomicrobiota bacterium]